MPDGLTPAAKVASLFGVTLRTLSNWEKRGILIPVRRLGYRYYRVSDVMRLLEQDSE